MLLMNQMTKFMEIGLYTLLKSVMIFFPLEIKNRIKKIPIDIKIGWVKGYQSGQRDWWGKIKINVFTLFLC